MGALDTYDINLKSLPEGVSRFAYRLDDKFFGAADSEEVTHGGVDVTLEVKTSTHQFELLFDLCGTIEVQCDRCLEDMQLPIATQQRLIVKLGKEYAEVDDELIVVPEEEGVLDIQWLMYEFVVLCIPIQHFHPEGECDPEMARRLRQFAVVVEGDVVMGGYSNGDTSDDDDKPLDPRWEALKGLK